jgi:hypothetical protein
MFIMISFIFEVNKCKKMKSVFECEWEKDYVMCVYILLTKSWRERIRLWHIRSHNKCIYVVRNKSWLLTFYFVVLCMLCCVWTITKHCSLSSIFIMQVFTFVSLWSNNYYKCMYAILVTCKPSPCNCYTLC